MSNLEKSLLEWNANFNELVKFESCFLMNKGKGIYKPCDWHNVKSWSNCTEVLINNYLFVFFILLCDDDFFFNTLKGYNLL